MSYITPINQMMLFTTPKKLREIATKMETEMPKMLGGDDNTMYTFWSKNSKITVHTNQEEYEKMRQGRPHEWV